MQFLLDLKDDNFFSGRIHVKKPIKKKNSGYFFTSAVVYSIKPLIHFSKPFVKSTGYFVWVFHINAHRRKTDFEQIFFGACCLLFFFFFPNNEVIYYI